MKRKKRLSTLDSLTVLDQTIKTERDLEKAEKALDECHWVRRACSYWEDPTTGQHHPASVAYQIAMQRQTRQTVRELAERGPGPATGRKSSRSC